MPVNIGTKGLVGAFVGDKPVSAIYIGSSLVWSGKATDMLLTPSKLGNSLLAAYLSKGEIANTEAEAVKPVRAEFFVNTRYEAIAGLTPISAGGFDYGRVRVFFAKGTFNDEDRIDTTATFTFGGNEYQIRLVGTIYNERGDNQYISAFETHTSLTPEQKNQTTALVKALFESNEYTQDLAISVSMRSDFFDSGKITGGSQEKPDFELNITADRGEIDLVKEIGTVPEEEIRITIAKGVTVKATGISDPAILINSYFFSKTITIDNYGTIIGIQAGEYVTPALEVRSGKVIVNNHGVIEGGNGTYQKGRQEYYEIRKPETGEAFSWDTTYKKAFTQPINMVESSTVYWNAENQTGSASGVRETITVGGWTYHRGEQRRLVENLTSDPNGPSIAIYGVYRTAQAFRTVFEPATAAAPAIKGKSFVEFSERGTIIGEIV